MLDRLETINATGRLHNKGITVTKTTAQPAPTFQTIGSMPLAPPDTVKKMTLTRENISILRLAGTISVG